jgi:hypothetical protein
MQFTEENIDAIFGIEDAENENESRFREYFFANRAYERILSDTSLRILVGYKGVGKSALLKRAYLQQVDDGKLSLFLTPDEISTVSETTPPNVDFIALVQHWKRGIISIIAQEIFQNKSSEFLNKINIGKKFNISNFIPSIIDFMSNNKDDIVDSIRNISVEQFSKTNEINVFIDDIDRGWSASKKNITNISALITAIRDIAGSQKQLKFRIGLRTDVFYLVRTSDESTDKIEGKIVWLKWTNHEVLSIIAKRISTFFKMPYAQDQISRMSQTEIDNKILSKVIETEFNVGRGHWANRPIHNILLSLTRKRPRDLVKLLRGAAVAAEKSEIISSTALESTFPSYSQQRLQDVINEFRTECQNIEGLLMEMRPTKRQKKTQDSYRFTNDQMLTKINQASRSTTVIFTNGKPATSKAILQFLYKIDFITARIDKANHIERQHFDENRILAHEAANFGYDWEIHPAYRWALQPQDINDVIDSLKSEKDIHF